MYNKEELVLKSGVKNLNKKKYILVQHPINKAVDVFKHSTLLIFKSLLGIWHFDRPKDA